MTNLCICGCDLAANCGRWFIGHWNRGKKYGEERKAKISAKAIGRKISEETREKLRQKVAWNKNLDCPQLAGKNNGNWKGDNVGYHGLHYYIRKNLPAPERCQNCESALPVEVACITGIYNRDLSNWKWLCILCHKRLDHCKDMSDRVCSICGSNKAYLNKQTGYSFHWHYSKITGLLLCSNCNLREYYHSHPEYRKKKSEYLKVWRSEHIDRPRISQPSAPSATLDAFLCVPPSREKKK